MRFFKEQTASYLPSSFKYLRICLHHSNRWNFEIGFSFSRKLIVSKSQKRENCSQVLGSPLNFAISNFGNLIVSAGHFSRVYTSVSFFVVFVATNIVIRFIHTLLYISYFQLGLLPL